MMMMSIMVMMLPGYVHTLGSGYTHFAAAALVIKHICRVYVALLFSQSLRNIAGQSLKNDTKPMRREWTPASPYRLGACRELALILHYQNWFVPNPLTKAQVSHTGTARLTVVGCKWLKNFS